MDVKTYKNIQQDAISQLANEYRTLLHLSSPSDEQLNRIEEILDIAISNPKVSKSLYEVDEELALELSRLKGYSFSEDTGKSPHLFDANHRQKLNYLIAPNIQLDETNQFKHHISHYTIKESKNSSNIIQFPHQHIIGSEKLSFNESIKITKQDSQINLEMIEYQKNKVLWCDIKAVVSYFISGGILVFAIAPVFFHAFKDELESDNQVKNTADTSSLSSTGNDSHPEMICSWKPNPNNQEINQDYVSYYQLKIQIENHQLQSLEIKAQVRELRGKIQTDDESQTSISEKKNNYQLTQTGKNQVSNAFAESKQLVCLGK